MFRLTSSISTVLVTRAPTSRAHLALGRADRRDGRRRAWSCAPCVGRRIDPVPPDAVARFLNHDEALVVETRPYPGAVGALEAVTHAPSPCSTNRAASVLILERLDLAQFFSDVFGGGSPAAGASRIPTAVAIAAASRRRRLARCASGFGDRFETAQAA
jgi:phosphoglycolate phosphatase-like HAD superfamily hydrolase